MNKKGVTIVSLVVYVILLFGFTYLALNTSANMSTSLFKDKAEAVNMSSLDKLTFYLNNSACKSYMYTLNGENEIQFSNGDKYVYDAANKILKMNDGKFLVNVTNFEIVESENTLLFNVTFENYAEELTRNIKICVEVM